MEPSLLLIAPLTGMAILLTFAGLRLAKPTPVGGFQPKASRARALPKR